MSLRPHCPRKCSPNDLFHDFISECLDWIWVSHETKRLGKNQIYHRPRSIGGALKWLTEAAGWVCGASSCDGTLLPWWDFCPECCCPWGPTWLRWGNGANPLPPALLFVFILWRDLFFLQSFWSFSFYYLIDRCSWTLPTFLKGGKNMSAWKKRKVSPNQSWKILHVSLGSKLALQKMLQALP